MANLRKSLLALSAAAGNIASEATLRQYFIQALDEFVKSEALFSKEAGPLFRLEEPVIRGRADAKIGGLTFEVKLPKPKGDGIGAAVKQVRRYIEEYAESGISVRGIAYDGVSLAVLDEQGEIVDEGPVQDVATLLAAWLTLLAAAARTPDDMVSRFGSASALSQQTIKTLFDLFQQYETRIPFIAEVFSIWREVYGCAANINSDTVKSLRRTAKELDIEVRAKKDAERFVFVTETYLSIFLKFLVAKVAAEQRLIAQTSVAQLICQPRGREHTRYTELGSIIPHLVNVFEEDPFEWFIDAARADREAETRVRAVLACIVESIDNVELLRMGQDFLRIFYQSFFDSASRRALGEFYTNTDLVKQTLDAVGYDGDAKKKIIDFSCGSGSFLVEILNRVKARAKNKKRPNILADIESHIFGVDIHPLAVAMARVNYLIAVAPLLSPTVTFSIPIYWADSLVRLSVREQTRHMMGAPIKISIPGMRRFSLPEPSMFDWEKLFDFVRDAIGKYSGPVEFDAVWNRFMQDFSPEQVLPHETVLTDFIRQIVNRHNAGKDTRWLPMLRNILFLERQKGQFDFIVGNPPWVRIHNIDEELRQRIIEDYTYCSRAGWKYGSGLSGSRTGFAKQLDLCVPFVERAFELLRQSGKFSFVLTSKVQQALYANELRRHIVTSKRLLRIFDYSLFPVALFKDAINYPLILSIENSAPSDDLDVEVGILNSEKKLSNFKVKQSELSLLPDDRESPWLMAPPKVVDVFRKMQRNGHVLGEVPETRPRMGIKTSANEIFIVTKRAPTESPEEIVVTTEDGTIARMESEMLRPLVRGRDIHAWGCEQSNWIIWTHDDDSGEVLESLPRRAEAYFADPERVRVLRKRDDYREAMPVWTLFRVSRDKLGPKVAWKKYGTQMQSAMLPRCQRNGKSCPLLVPLQTTYFIPVDDTDIAHFLTGVLNSLPFRAFLMSFSVRAQGAFFHYTGWIVGLGVLPVSEEQRKTEYRAFHGTAMHKRTESKIMALSKKLHEGLPARKVTLLESKLDATVAEAYSLSPGELTTIRDYYLFMRPPVTVADELLESEDAED